MVTALQNLRDAVDSELAKYCPDDDIVTILGSTLDAATEQLQRLTAWIEGPDVE